MGEEIENMVVRAILFGIIACLDTLIILPGKCDDAAFAFTTTSRHDTIFHTTIRLTLQHHLCTYVLYRQ